MPPINEKIGRIPEQGEAVYRLFPDALDLGLLDLDAVKMTTAKIAAEAINNGFMPPEGSVVVEDIDDEAAAFDHTVVLRMSSKELVLAPSAKCAVDSKTNRILEPGLTSFIRSVGFIKPMALFTAAERVIWQHSKFKKVGRGVGAVAIQRLGIPYGYEIERIEENGFTVARTPMRRFHSIG